MRIVLAYILARSVWQYYNSDWMKSPWTSKSIHFMFEPHSDPASSERNIYACRPYYAFQFDEPDGIEEYCHMPSIVHRYPRILALGNILVDIARNLQQVSAAELNQTPESKINSDWSTGMKALRDEDWPAFNFSTDSQVAETYRRLVMKCFGEDILRRTQGNISNLVEDRRAFLYENVVYPLEKLLIDMQWRDAINSIEPMHTEESITEGLRVSTLSSKKFTVGWVCALPIELAAATEMLDEEYVSFRDEDDEDIYTFGRIADHNVVIACLPAGQVGTNSAAVVAIRLRLKFPSLRFGLLVGVGGGVPSQDADIRLGDVVISQPEKGRGGVIQYDFGKNTPDGFMPTNFLNTPPPILLSALTNLRANQFRQQSSLRRHLMNLRHIPEFALENAGPDHLFQASYRHKGGSDCRCCSEHRTIARLPRKRREIAIHYGTIASGNQVMRDGKLRDTISAKFGGVLCFEMEAAGLMNSFPCLVIRGICDYADSHKNKSWQPYASATAAACAKELLCLIPRAEVITAKAMAQEL
jgi:nucleoside phosphorylase